MTLLPKLTFLYYLESCPASYFNLPGLWWEMEDFLCLPRREIEKGEEETKLSLSFEIVL